MQCHGKSGALQWSAINSNDPKRYINALKEGRCRHPAKSVERSYMYGLVYMLCYALILDRPYIHLTCFTASTPRCTDGKL